MKRLYTLLTSASLLLAFAGGVLPQDFVQTVSAAEQAQDDAEKTGSIVLDEKTGTLTLSGNITAAEVQKYAKSEAVNAVVAAEGCVFPAFCSGMFADFCTESIDLSKADTSNVTDMSKMFENCRYLAALDLTGLDTSRVKNMSSMFQDCKDLTKLDISGFDTAKVEDMFCMFASCEKLTELDVSGFETSSVMNMSGMFYGCSSLTELDLYRFNTINVMDMSAMFSECSSLTELEFYGFNTINVRNMSGMFYNCDFLTTLDLSAFNTTNVEDMSSMFSDCDSLTTLDLSGFNTARVENMFCMFFDDSNLKTLDISGFDTAKVTNMEYMFNGCSSLTELDLSGFDTSNVTNMYYMFNGCSSLTELDLSGFDTSNVTYMYKMFSGCSSLTELDLSSFNTPEVDDMSTMFKDDTNLKTIYVSDTWKLNRPKYSTEMFSGCEALIGGNGTVYNPQHVDGTYARIDTADAPGYLTYQEKSAQDKEWAFDEKTGTLTLYSAQINSDLYEFNRQNPDKIEHIVCAKGCVFHDYDLLSFHDFSSVETIDVSKADFSQFTDMNGMFDKEVSLSRLYEIKKAPVLGASGWSVADSNCRPLPCEGSALNQLS